MVADFDDENFPWDGELNIVEPYVEDGLTIRPRVIVLGSDYVRKRLWLYADRALFWRDAVPGRLMYVSERGIYDFIPGLKSYMVNGGTVVDPEDGMGVGFIAELHLYTRLPDILYKQLRLAPGAS